MKISLITLHFIKNYGSVLQTYATQEYLKKMGHEVEVVDYWQERFLDKNIIKGSLQFSETWSKSRLKRLVYTMIKLPSMPKIKKVFNTFLKEHINLTPKRYYNLAMLKKEVPKADIYMTGSDQVWNSCKNPAVNRMYFLDYAPKGKKRIAFAASFGRPELEDWEKEETIELLQKYDSISVREKSGEILLKKLGFSNVETVLDPTLMLNKEDWSKIASKRLIKEKYLLMYILNESKQVDKYVKKVAKRKGLKVITLAYEYHDMIKYGKTMVCPKIEEFLSLIKYADLVVTDSFHATAFSINFNTNFVSIYPKRTGTRIQSILQLTGLENRHIDDLDNLEIVDENINFTEANQKLDEERKHTREFLEKSIGE